MLESDIRNKIIIIIISLTVSVESCNAQESPNSPIDEAGVPLIVTRSSVGKRGTLLVQGIFR